MCLTRVYGFLGRLCCVCEFLLSKAVWKSVGGKRRQKRRVFRAAAVEGRVAPRPLLFFSTIIFTFPNKKTRLMAALIKGDASPSGSAPPPKPEGAWLLDSDVGLGAKLGLASSTSRVLLSSAFGFPQHSPL